MMKFMSFRIVWNDKFGTPWDVKIPAQHEVKGERYPHQKLTWKLKMRLSKRNLLFQSDPSFRFYVSFQGGKWYVYQYVTSMLDYRSGNRRKTRKAWMVQELLGVSHLLNEAKLADKILLECACIMA